MAKAMFVFDEPETCSECCFLGGTDYIIDGSHYPNDYLYRRIAACKISPQSVKDPWKEVHWLANNKPEWCPLKPIKEE